MKKIVVAQIGISKYGHGRIIFESLKKQTEVFDIRGYALPENERQIFPEQCDVFNGYREMTIDEILNDSEIEAVFIETEEIYLTKYAIMAAEKKKHIHMEKPGGLDILEFSRLINIVKQNQTIFHVGYMYRYNPIIKKLMKDVKKGEFGDIISVEAQMSAPFVNEHREWLEIFPSGIMFYLGCHLIDLILQIQGMPERIVSLNKETGIEGINSKDFGMVVFEYKSGVSFAKTIAVEAGGYMRRQLVVTGTKKTVELKPLEIVLDGRYYTDFTTYLDSDWHSAGVWKRSESYDRYDNMIAGFAMMVREEKENPYTYDYELELYKILTKCCKD